MNKLKITGLASILFLTSVFVISCDKEDDKTVYTNNNIQLKASSVVTTPGNTLPATTGYGSMQATYDKSSKLLTYTIKWDTLSAAPIAVHIHGLADSGQIALPAPVGPYTIDSIRLSSSAPWIRYAGGIAQRVILPTSPAPRKAGTFSGQLLVDDVVIRESDLLAGKYYVDIHTASSPLFVAFGEVRGQITFPHH